MPYFFEGAKKHWKQILLFCFISVIFWLLQFFYQKLIEQEPIEVSLVRSFAFAGTTFIALSLLTSIVFKFSPKLAVNWPLRRNLGVVGALFVLFHVFFASGLYFSFNFDLIYPTFDPFENPIVFGALALPIFILLTLTSTDFAVQKLGSKWKTIQQFAHIAFMLSIFHFLLQNPKALKGPPWYLLATTTFFVLLGQLYWFVKITLERKKISTYTLVGLCIIIIYLAFALYKLKN
ncbi:MAG: hypothetical protein QXU92_02470 [Candidatus Diapherotrites archaeon]